MSHTFTRDFAVELAKRTQAEGYRMFVVMGFHQNGDVNATVLGGTKPDDLAEIAVAFGDLLDELESHVAFQEPQGNA